MKTAAVLIEGGVYALFFRRHGRSIWQLQCPRPAGIGHPWQKKIRKKRLCPGASLGGGGGWGRHGRSWNCLIHYFNKKGGDSAFV